MSNVSDFTVSDSIVSPVMEPSLLSARFPGIKEIIAQLNSKLDECITRLTALVVKLVFDSSLHSLPDNVHYLSTRLTHCQLNHDAVVQNFYNYKKDVRNFFVKGAPSYINSSNIPSPSHDYDVTMSFRMVLETIGNPLDPHTIHHFYTFLTQYNK